MCWFGVSIFLVDSFENMVIFINENIGWFKIIGLEMERVGIVWCW